MNDVITTELPTLTFTPVEYRTGPREFGLFHGATRNINPGQSMHDWSPDQLWDYGNHTSAHAVSIWNEAHNEHARRAVLDWEQALLQETVIVEHPTREVELERMLSAANDRIRELEQQQITGDDPRLATFWENAQRIADYADYCDVFDRMAEELGGPRRMRDYGVDVEVRFTVRVNVSATDENDALQRVETEEVVESVREYLDGFDSSDWDAENAEQL